jgi:hypothetical protein
MAGASRLRLEGMVVIVGICLGILLGILSGVAAVLLLYTAWGAKVGDLVSLLKIVAELLAIPTFWFAGPFFTSSLIRSVPVEQMINPYMSALTLVFAAVVIGPLLRLTKLDMGPWARP